MDNKESKDKNEKGLLRIICIIGIVIICIILLVVIFLNSSKTVTTGEPEGTVTTDHMTCTSNDTDYPFFGYDNSDKKELKIDATFKDNKLASISLIYKLYYSDANQISISESSNHADMNISFGEKGLNPDALNATYSKLPDNLQFSIYANDDKLTSSSLTYFMLDTGKTNSNEEFISNYYSNMGMNCKITK